MKVLRVLANPKTVENSASLKIEHAFTAALKQKHPEAQVLTIDVYKDEVPLLDEKLLPAFFGAPPADAETARKRERQKAILDQFLAADLVVIATPMWNFNAPPMLKAFIDTILVAGKTFTYTATGPVGLVSGKRAVLCIASGGVYEGALAAYDTLTPMLKTQLGFIGVTDVTVLNAPGQGAGGEKAAASTAAAIEKAKEAAAKF
ncbi:MAG TPA: NAD(P)H-dependent oxidoreductase [Kiritimatiellia bacterium]|nr:NAD(P)H-dependent oxidoreductase [Kiritimatiellia bacterium]